MAIGCFMEGWRRLGRQRGLYRHESENRFLLQHLQRQFQQRLVVGRRHRVGFCAELVGEGRVQLSRSGGSDIYCSCWVPILPRLLLFWDRVVSCNFSDVCLTAAHWLPLEPLPEFTTEACLGVSLFKVELDQLRLARLERSNNACARCSSCSIKPTLFGIDRDGIDPLPTSDLATRLTIRTVSVARFFSVAERHAIRPPLIRCPFPRQVATWQSRHLGRATVQSRCWARARQEKLKIWKPELVRRDDVLPRHRCLHEPCLGRTSF
jgi:hypothetical protein